MYTKRLKLFCIPFVVFFILPGGHREGETPGPIPNPEVKPFVADDTPYGGK